MTPSKRYVLFRKTGKPDASDLERLRRIDGVSVVDATSDRAFLIEASDHALQQLALQSPEWVIAPERVHPLD